jgi:hypothetical protein
MIANPQLEMFGLNIMLLIGLLTAGVIGLVVFFALWTGIKILLFRRRQRQGELDHELAKRDPMGRLLPPTTPGVCHQCGKAYRKVHHLPSGKRYCPDCYRARQNA